MTLERLPFVVFMLLAAISMPLSAQTGTAETSMTEGVNANIAQPDLPLRLIVGTIEGKVTASPLDEKYQAGASAFVQVRLSTAESARPGVTAELLLKPEFGEIVQITGSDSETHGQNGERVVIVKGIRKGSRRTLLIEMKLHAIEGEPANRLELALRLPDGNASQELKAARQYRPDVRQATLAWPVTSCADDYHAALRKIGEQGGNSLRKTWQAALGRDKTMSRRWMFSPTIPKRGVRSNERSDDEAISPSDVRAIFTETHKLMQRGFDSDLRREGRYGWIIPKTANDLRKYLSQPMKPAICTGALGFVAYYEDRFAPLRKRGQRLDALLAKAESLAREKTKAFIEKTRNAPGGHPAWGGATLIALAPSDVTERDMAVVAAELVMAANFPADLAESVSAARTGYDALKIIYDHGIKPAGVEPSLRRDLTEAFSAIEAAIRMEAFRARYKDFLGGFQGKFDAIRAAYSKHCVCSS